MTPYWTEEPPSDPDADVRQALIEYFIHRTGDRKAAEIAASDVLELIDRFQVREPKPKKENTR